MLHFSKRFTRVSARAFSSADHLGHFIDGITHPRSPPASRSSNPCSLRSNSASPPPLWLPTHSVFNQAPPLQNFDAFSSDRALVECIRALHATFPTQTPSDGQLLRSISNFAASSSSQIIHEHAFLAHANPPALSTHDRTGIRRDHVEYHPSYHRLMAFGIENRVPSLAYANKNTSAAMACRSALQYMYCQVEPGVNCPLTMTFAAVPALLKDAAIAAAWVPKLMSDVYDTRQMPVSAKLGVTVGMSMTEKQGGSDVRANTTVARPVDPARTGSGAVFSLTGHKWFTSAPMSDGFLTLSNTLDDKGASRGLACFLVPRVLDDGKANEGFRVMRLKNKIGDRSNASSEVEYHDAVGYLIGEHGRGVKTIMEMVALTRLDCATGSAGIMRSAVFSAGLHVSQRKAFGKTLLQQMSMAGVLADLEVECEASTHMALAAAAALGSDAGEEGAAFARLAVPISKYYICKRATPVVVEALECHGGNGYVEDNITARLYRQAPLNSIWEGSGNVQCIDILRAMTTHKDSIPAFFGRVHRAKGASSHFDAFAKRVEVRAEQIALRVGSGHDESRQARALADDMAVCLQGSLLLTQGHAEVAKAFVASRVCRERYGVNWGTLDSSIDVDLIAQRAVPVLNQ